MSHVHTATTLLEKGHHRFSLHISTRLLIGSVVMLVGTLLAMFGALLLQVLRAAGE